MKPVAPAFFDALYEQTEDMVHTLCEWIAIPSVANESATDGTPYGEACLAMLERIEADALSLGLSCRRHEGHVLTVNLNEEAETVLGIACHADVVDAGAEGWRFPPFQGTVADGFVFGRGASDNKGAGVSALYALAFLKKAGLTDKNIRLYFGSDEENGSACLRHYQAHYERAEDMPPMIVPDAGNEIIYGEWGVLRATLSAPLCKRGKVKLLSLAAGEAMNIIPGRAEATLSGLSLSFVNEAIKALGEEGVSAEELDGVIRLTAVGKSCHSSLYKEGINAAVRLLALLCRLPFSANNKAVFSCLYRLYTAPPADIGQALAEERLTFSLTGLFLEEGRILSWHDSRCSYTVKAEKVEESIKEALLGTRLKAAFQRTSQAHIVDKNHPFILRLAEIYEACQGEKATVTEMKAATYASSLSLAVAYGQFEGENIHAVNERLPVEYLPKTAKLLAYTAYRIMADS